MSAYRVRQWVDNSDCSHVMELDNTSVADAGEYTVSASNEVGSCTTTALFVVDKYSGPPSPPLSDMYVFILN